MRGATGVSLAGKDARESPGRGSLAILPKTGRRLACVDLPGWADIQGYTCGNYVDRQWCTATRGYGTQWNTTKLGQFTDRLNTDNNGIDATRACCGCGGRGVKACLDQAGWVDKRGFTCDDYTRLQWCTQSRGYGSGWDTATFGAFTDYNNTNAGGVPVTTACCGCGAWFQADPVLQVQTTNNIRRALAIGLGAGSGALVLCLLCAFCCWRWRAHLMRSIWLEEYHGKVSFHTQRSPRRRGEGPAGAGAAAAAGDNKSRVVWNVDMDRFNRWFGNDQGAGRATTAVPVTAAAEGPNPKVDSGNETNEEHVKASDEVPPPSAQDCYPAYTPAQRVEYLSVTNVQWVPGRVEVRLTKDADEKPHVRYDAMLRKSQKRLDVQLSDLRLPLQDGEAVDVLLNRSGGVACIPGHISGQHGPSACSVGYTVVMEGEAEGPVKHVGARLRRRFRGGEAVQVYTGPVLGWQPRTVHSVAGEDGRGVQAVAALPRTISHMSGAFTESTPRHGSAASESDGSPRSPMSTGSKERGVLPLAREVSVPRHAGRQDTSTSSLGGATESASLRSSSPPQGGVLNCTWVLVPLAADTVPNGTSGGAAAAVEPASWVHSSLIRRSAAEPPSAEVTPRGVADLRGYAGAAAVPAELIGD